MRTRQLDYALDDTKIQQYSILRQIISDFKDKKKRSTPFKRVQMMNTIILHLLKYFSLLQRIERSTAVIALEKHYTSMLGKKAEFEEEIMILALKEGGDSLQFQEKSKKLIQNCAALNRKIHDYLNRKYSVILIKTNRDIYRNILSFL